eukprot:jgi/Bigna1/60304/fgenesh1_kg.10_\
MSIMLASVLQHLGNVVHHQVHCSLFTQCSPKPVPDVGNMHRSEVLRGNV